MEHIVQFGISIDDNQIAKRINEHAYDDVCNRLMNDCINNLPAKSPYKIKSSKVDDINWRYLVEEQIKNFLHENKEEIIQASAKEMANCFKRTRAWKETVNDVIEKETDK